MKKVCILAALSITLSAQIAGPHRKIFSVAGCAGFCIQNEAYGISSTAVTSISAGAMTGVISGHTLLAFVRDGQTGSTITCSDTLGNTWVNLTSSSFAGIGTIQWCYSENIMGGGSDIVSAAVTSGTFVTIQVYECGGASLTSPIDLNAVKTFSAASTWTSNNFTTASAHEIIFYGIGVGSIALTLAQNGIGGNTATPTCTGIVTGTGTSLACSGGPSVSGTEYYIASTVQTTKQASFTATGGTAIAASAVVSIH